jgi:hypothetical protein
MLISFLTLYILEATIYLYVCLMMLCRSQLPRGLRHRSVAARLLGSRVRIPLGHGCLSLVLSCAGRGLCDGLITRPEESYRVSNSVCDLKTSKEEANALFGL